MRAHPQVARTMAPSVILIDEVEKVFVADKKKAKEFGGQVGAVDGSQGWTPKGRLRGVMRALNRRRLAPMHRQEPFSRIKKDLVKEVKALRPGDRVIVIGNSREPWLAAKKDERAFLAFWDKVLPLPLPDYASRRVGLRVGAEVGWGGLSWFQQGWLASGLAHGRAWLWGWCVTPPATPRHPPVQLLWPGLFARHGARLPYGFDVPTLAHLSEGHAAGAIGDVAASVLGESRLARLRRGGAGAAVTVAEILQWLSKVCAWVGGWGAGRGRVCRQAPHSGGRCLSARHACRTHPARRPRPRPQLRPVAKEDDEALRRWVDKTPALAAIKGTGAAGDVAGTPGGGGKKGGDKESGKEGGGKKGAKKKKGK
jgi:hypothetical protein